MRTLNAGSRIGALALLVYGLAFPRLFAGQEALQRRVDAVLDKWVGQGQLVGAVVLVARDGHVVYHRAAGWADREKQLPMSETAVFRLASMSKALVSAAALALVDEGKLELDAPVTRWVPDFQPALPDGRKPAITIRQLLSHTAGLNYGFFDPTNGPYHRAGVSDGLDNSPVSLEENVRRIGSAPLLFEPGSQWHYSLAVDVLGLVVARAGGAPLPDVVARTITRPLGMKDTGFAATDASRLTVAYAPGQTPAPMREPQPIFMPGMASPMVFSPSRATNAGAWPSSGAGVLSTARDYLKFLEAIRTGGAPILTSASARAMVTDIAPTNAATSGPGWGFGLGFGVLRNRTAGAHEPRANGTFGWGGVYGHHDWVDPQNRLTLVCLTDVAFTGMAGPFPEELRDAIYAGLAN